MEKTNKEIEELKNKKQQYLRSLLVYTYPRQEEDDEPRDIFGIDCETCALNNATKASYRDLEPLCYKCHEELNLFLEGRIYTNQESYEWVNDEKKMGSL